MSRGPTRRVRQLIADGLVSPELLVAADREADYWLTPRSASSTCSSLGWVFSAGASRLRRCAGG
jgi:hypothetical protein